ncbi:hypothetical protein G7L40_19955 [Paenibacillus polymyxa]|uniref:hypothetical protein n=1 Tax=Paenibacillus polymyxa TaxID=1406 RepID=UPI0018C3E626|nr:hypothetical protein [Paenibacillus polymyxa]QPK54747.1 hypothetical protein G7035_19995 [Paenibacillus polymyxa]QPK59838.1 hypothetical protein G7L40_19955 [Paenibacillus polymyxa]
MKYSENDAYIKAKRKLFHLIKNNNLIIVDQNDKQYNFTLTNKKDEFLNLEYPTSYKSKKAIGLNNYYPCLLKLIKDYEIDMPSKSCNKEAFTGYNETVPCLKCVKSNLTKSNIIFDYHSKHKNFLVLFLIYLMVLKENIKYGLRYYTSINVHHRKEVWLKCLVSR